MPWNSPIARPNWRRSLAYAHCGVERGLREPDRARGDAEPTGVESGERDLEALALDADEPVARDVRGVEDAPAPCARPSHPSCARAVALESPAVSASASRHEIPRGAVVGGAHHEVVEVGHSPVGDPRLRAGDDVVVALAHGAGLQRRGVGARRRLGQAVGAEQLAAEHVGQPALLLLVGAVRRDREAGERVHGHRHAHRQPGAGELLERLQVDLVGLAAAAELLVRTGRDRSPALPERAQHVAGERRRRARRRRPWGASSESAMSRTRCSRSTASSLGSIRSAGVIESAIRPPPARAGGG